MSNADFQTIKVYKTTYAKLQELIDKLARRGWTSVGANRDDPFTIANVMEEAVTALHERKELPKERGK